MPQQRLTTEKGLVFHKQIKNAAAIAPLKTYAVPIAAADVTNFQPFNALTVHNTSSQGIEVRYDGSLTRLDYLPPGTILNYDLEDGLLFRGIVLYNVDAAQSIDVNEIRCIVKAVNK